MTTAFLISGLLLVGPASAAPAPKAKSAAEAEKEKALKEPFANDLGPDTVDVAAYPREAQAGYKLLRAKCTTCHTASRPLNSQFAEAEGKNPAARDAAAAALLKSDPELGKLKLIWQVEGGIWQRYVKRMMNKPGCTVTEKDAKGIWTFLSHDSRVRKLGKGKAAWKKHREKLLADFKVKFPKRYAELYSAKP